MDLHPESLVVASGRPAHHSGQPLNTPIDLAASYHSGPDGNAYRRNESSDSIRAFEVAVAAIEGGGTTVAYASGMGAVAAVVEGMPSGTVAIVPSSCYSGTANIFAEAERLGRLTVRRVDITNTEATLAALDGAGLLWLETVTNPLLGVADLPPLLDAARRFGALSCVDATFTTPLSSRPLDLGADIAMHSATKYLGGHSDLLMGVLTTRSDDLAAWLGDRRRIAGAMPGALECYLALRGMRTIVVRFERQVANAGELARRLAAHPAVSRVRYPGLASDPGHHVAARVHSTFGAVVCFEVAGTVEQAERVCDAVRLITHATSLGAVESLIERRAKYGVDAANGAPPTLLRLSVGIEHVEDLWSDLSAALDSGLGT
jgi:cystathionine gamma-synthase